jgi:hypothetical protein
MRNINIREYLSIPWIKFLFWTAVVIAGVIIIGILANYLTKIVFNL